ncbi:MAG: 2-amino-4-hydroxy-6-hydroxymethyldihydropteridine diphosphokinase [Gammaproteobacteria bacterium]|nr:2-amino-4-hydroxy-6-hydroxymethyldihydropteridine diphosphokinase [Gammaproteobacteria bacterium]MDH3466486.1 2-amino-4-hydroxy-6-hydroxymethyldihydropteridine diphosphokinase [Gammaproteobacteria bacterium]
MSGAAYAYIGLGSNLHEPERQVGRAIEALRTIKEATLSAVSSLYRTAPIGPQDQPDFINAVCQMTALAGAYELFSGLRNIEDAFGRTRETDPNGPRMLDLDLLLYGELQLALADLQIPHPRMHLRRFVLEPLLELDPDVAIPGQGAARELLRHCLDQRVARIQH